MKRSLWTFILILLLTACRQTPNPPPVVSTSTVVVVPPTPLPPHSPTPPPTPQASQPPPERVWLPYGDTGYPTLTVREGKISDEPSPVSITVFWDYTPLTGRLAYGNEPFHTNTITNQESVTDLWVYDYNTGKKELWLEDNVMGALWSPVIDPKTGLQPLAVALPNNTLALMTGPGQLVTLSETFASFFSWSPDGRWLAFSEAEALFVTSVETGETRQLTAREDPWYRAKPVWAPKAQALIYAYKSFVRVVKLDGSEAFIPVTADGDPLPERPARVVNLLWTEQGSRLITESGSTGTDEVTIYNLSDDLRTILSSYTLEAVGLGGWLVPGESLILDGGPLWSLAKAAPLETASGTIFSNYSLDGQWRVDVLAYNGCFGGWGRNKSYQHLSFVHLNSGVEQIVDRQFRDCAVGLEPNFKDLFWSPNNRYLYYARTAEIAESACRYQRQLLRRLALPPDGSSPPETGWDITRLGGGALSPDGAKLAAWQLQPSMGEDFTSPAYELIIWDINSGEQERPGSLLVYPAPAPMAWSPNSQTLIYLQFETGCPPDGKTQLIQLDFPDLTQKLLLTTENPNFSDIIWDHAPELRLFNGALEWRYNFDTQELRPWY